MALRSKKDIKKSSYYVWFLGAQESRGLRGEEFALPAIEHLERRSKDLEPFKVTLQVSHKGLKIVQNVAPKGKQQTIKHFIPHGSITSAVVQGDVVACVLLLFNPVTRCPIHVHAYRCDSDNTAEILCTHLRALIDRPENQKKFADIERKLQIKGALPQANKKVLDSSLGSEVSTKESESGSSEERCVATLYDSLAAELKQKLSTGKSPILLPPRDYDTVHRQKGNLSGIETRRCLNQSIVGVNARRKLESSGGSSGIGSDLAPSPDRNEYPRQHDNQSTSEEDWAESTAYLMHEGFDVTPPQRALSPRRDIYHSSKYPEERMYRQESLETPNKYAEGFAYQRRYAQRQQSPPPAEQLRNSNRNSVSIERVHKETNKFEKVPTRNGSRKNGYGSNAPKLTRGMSEGSLMLADGSISPKDRFNVAKEKFMNLERERFNQELEKHMQIRRSMLEKNQRASSPEEFKNNRESRKWSREDNEDEVVLECRAELPRAGQRYPSRDDGQNGVDKRYYEYGTDEYYEQRSPADADRRRLAGEDMENERYYSGNSFAEPNRDYRQSRRYDNSDNRRRDELDRRIKEDYEVRDTRIEPVIEDRKKRIADPKRLSRIDAVRDDRDRYEAKPANAENQRGAAPEDEWSNQRRPVSRSRLLQEPNKRHSAYDAEIEARRTFEMRKSYAEVNNNGFPNVSRNYERYGPGNGPALGTGREPQLRYREEGERRDRYLAPGPGLDSAKLRHSYAEPMIRNRVGIAPVRPY